MKTLTSVSDINIARILRLTWQESGISRIEIANKLNLDKSTVTKTVNELKARGFINEVAQGSSGPQGGRRPVALEVSNNFACFGGIEITPAIFTCCILDIHGNVLYEHLEEINSDEYKGTGFEGVLTKAIRMIEAEAQKIGIILMGIGVGLPGLVNSKAGKISYSIPLMMEESFPFAETVKKITSIPVVIDNDSRCCCFGEMMATKNHLTDNLMYLLTEYRSVNPLEATVKNLSIGIGLLINGEIVTGPECYSGEFRSILCQKGFRGQLYSGDENLDLEKMSEAQLEVLFAELAQHIAFLVHILNIQSVCIGGGINDKYEEIIESQIKKRIDYQWPYSFPKNYNVYKSAFNKIAVAYGAASMVIEQFFKEPNLSGNSDDQVSLLIFLQNLV